MRLLTAVSTVRVCQGQPEAASMDIIGAVFLCLKTHEVFERYAHLYFNEQALNESYLKNFSLKCKNDAKKRGEARVY